MGKRRALIPCLHIFLHVFIFIGFIAVVPLGSMYFNYTDFVKQILGVEDVVACPPSCTIDLAPQLHASRAIIVVDNPSGTLVALNAYATQSQRKLIATDRTTRLEVFFTGGLYVDVYPLYPFSDAEPRSVYLPSGGNLTIRVTPPAIGGTLPTLIVVIGTLIGIMASLGIIKRVSKTPLVYAIGNTFPMYFEPIIIWLIVTANLLVLAVYLERSYGLDLLGMLRTLLPFILITIYTTLIVIMSERKARLLALYMGILFILYIAMPFLLLALVHPLLYFVVLIALVNPIVLLYLKGLVAIKEMERVKKVGVLHLYDLTIAFWALQWLINPYPTIFKHILYNLSYQFIISLFTIVLVLVFINLLIALLYHFIVEGPDFGTLLLSVIPFVFNEELAARVDFCHRTLDKPTKVRVYTEGGKPIIGFVVECDVSKIAVSDGKSMRMFSWGDVRQIELL